MPAGSLLALLDDIASVLDDVSVMTKVAAQKTAGVLGDDLALNAQQVTGIRAERELPVVWAVARGSLRNKLVLVPLALLLSALAPVLITPLLMLGGAFLCYEGFEKLAHRFFHAAADEAAHEAGVAAFRDPAVDLVAFEAEKIRGAIRTDFILSAEIIAITLGVVAEGSFLQQVTVLSGIALLMTAGVYGLVAAIVKLDDAGLHLLGRPDAVSRRLGRAMLAAAPWLLRALSVAGTVAMFLVGGGILSHGLPVVHHAIEGAAAAVAAGPVAWFGWWVPLLLDGAFGVLCGALVFGAVEVTGRMRRGLGAG
jgi:predicted DNA repair protein MutK